MSKILQDKVGIVTGASAGIGKATALIMAEEGAKVVVSDIDSERGQELVEEIKDKGGDAIFVECDVSKEDQVKVLVETTVKEYGKLDFAFNNAGYNGEFKPIADLDSEIWDQVMKINVYGAYYCMKHQIPAMLENGQGAIVNTASGAGVIGIANNPAYNAAKFAVVGMTRNVAMDYGSEKIRANALAPGSTMTEMMENAFEQNPGEEFREAVVGDIPMGVLAEPEDQAHAVAWLCSDYARMVNGITLPVDGGYLAGK